MVTQYDFANRWMSVRLGLTDQALLKDRHSITAHSNNEDVLCSYGNHFPLVTILRNAQGEPRLLLLNGDGSSSSTARHQSTVREVAASAAREWLSDHPGSELPMPVIPYGALESAGIDFRSIEVVEDTQDRFVWRPSNLSFTSTGVDDLPKTVTGRARYVSSAYIHNQEAFEGALGHHARRKTPAWADTTEPQLRSATGAQLRAWWKEVNGGGDESWSSSAVIEQNLLLRNLPRLWNMFNYSNSPREPKRELSISMAIYGPAPRSLRLHDEPAGYDWFPEYHPVVDETTYWWYTTDTQVVLARHTPSPSDHRVWGVDRWEGRSAMPLPISSELAGLQPGDELVSDSMENNGTRLVVKRRGDGTYRWQVMQQRHVLGESLIRAKWRRWATRSRRELSGTSYFISGFDANEPRLLYHLSQLPDGAQPRDLDHAYELLKPEAVNHAELNNLEVLRQGDIFAIETGLTKRQLTKLGATHTRMDYILGTNHICTDVAVLPDGRTLGRGIMRHRPIGRDADHVTVRLGDGKGWYALAKNTVPNDPVE